MAYDPNVLRRATEALEEQRRVHQLNTARLRADAYPRQPVSPQWGHRGASSRTSARRPSSARSFSRSA